MLKILSKKNDVELKEFLQDLDCFIVKKTLTLVVCSKCLAKAFGFIILSLYCLPFEKTILSRSVFQFHGENQTRLCFIKIDKLLHTSSIKS
jgi:hypothetical protein